MKKTLLSGMQPSNQLHLGNLVGALRNWVQLQEDYDCFFVAVDAHSITIPYEPKVLRENTYSLLAFYIAAGIDPEKCTLFVQSHVSEHFELAWFLTCHTYLGELNRMTQFKDKSARSGKNIPAGLFTYPVLMAADILAYRAHLVPVGEDQKQHLELTRDLADRLNNKYENLFVKPEPFIPKVGGRIMDLQDPTRKMGKSDSTEKGAVFLGDTDKAIEKKVKSAVTDSGSDITYDDSKPGIKNLLEIQAALTGKKIPELEKQYAGKQYGVLKVETASIVKDTVSPIRKRAEELLSDKGELSRILNKGADKARARAGETLAKVRTCLGFID